MCDVEMIKPHYKDINDNTVTNIQYTKYETETRQGA